MEYCVFFHRKYLFIIHVSYLQYAFQKKYFLVSFSRKCTCSVSKAYYTNSKVKAIISDLVIKSYLNMISVLNLYLYVFKSIYKSVLELNFLEPEGWCSISCIIRESCDKTPPPLKFSVCSPGPKNFSSVSRSSWLKTSRLREFYKKEASKFVWW